MKIINRIGDGLFRLTDSFFQGPYAGLSEKADKNPYPDQTTGMTWELNQGVEDILLKDLIISFNTLVPAFIRKPVAQLYKKACLYFLVDAVLEEEPFDPEGIKAPIDTISREHSGKIFTLIANVKTNILTHTISLHEWLKNKSSKINCYLHYSQPLKPYYLLGNFAPCGSDIYNDKSDFSHTYIFHLRN